MPTTQFGNVVRHIHSMAAQERLPTRTDRELLEEFSAQHDEAAFAELLARHGSMVYRICRRILNHDQDAEDAFQAVFLVLAHQSKSIRKRDALAEWLHGVAYRTAMKAKRAAARRRTHEAHLQTRPPAPVSGPSWDDVQLVLDEEIQQLPQAFRAAFVLCVLQGRTGAQAAKEMHVPIGTVWSRVTTARKRLQQRLSRRGIELSALLAAVSVAQSTSQALPARLAGAKFLADLIAAVTGKATGSIAPHVAALAKGVSRAFFFYKAKVLAGMLVAACMAAFAVQQVLSACRNDESAQLASVPSTATQSKSAEKPKAVAPDNSQETVTCSGRVLDPDGKPFAGAKLYLNHMGAEVEHRRVQAISGTDGRFSFTFKRPPADPGYGGRSWYQVIAVAPGFGPDWGHSDWFRQDAVPSTDMTLRLVKDVPLKGRIVDLEGKPVKGATLRVEHIDAYADNEAFLQSVRDCEWFIGESKGWNGPFPGQPQQITTGADGRFTMTGVGRDRVILFHLEGQGIQHGPVRALVREMAAAVQPRPMQYGPVITKVYGAAFDHAALPSRVIRGIVRDKKTGKPVAGVSVRASVPGAGGTEPTPTNGEGRYELLGCPKSAQGYQVSFTPPGHLYFSNSITIPDTPGLDPVQGDLELVSGILARGRVTHHVTGKPMGGVRVAYDPLYPNPYVKLLGSLGNGSRPCSWTTTAPDGTYNLVVLPGPGCLGFEARSPKEIYRPALVTTQELKAFFKDNDDHGNEDTLRTQARMGGFSVVAQEEYNELLLIQIGEHDQLVTRDVALRPARPLHGTVVNADGTRPELVTAYSLAPHVVFQPLKDGKFTVDGLHPRRARPLVFVDKDRKSGAYVNLLGETKEPLTVRLESCGSVSGRLLDQDGQPLAGAAVRLDPEGARDSGPARVQSDSNGRFRFDGLVPGQKHQARLGISGPGPYLFKPFTIQPGENKELGDFMVKPNK